jgi:hypothetical protein
VRQTAVSRGTEERMRLTTQAADEVAAAIGNQTGGDQHGLAACPALRWQKRHRSTRGLRPFARVRSSR